jgi:two-component system LytT family response regulator
MKCTAVIIDDEQTAIDMIAFLLKKYFPEIKIVGTETTISKGIDILKQHKPDILFLDIELKEGSGFQVRESTKDLNYLLIFTTAYAQYAIQAFKAQAIDYILKPIDEHDFNTSIQQVLLKIGTSNIQVAKKIHFSTHEGNIYVLPEEIIYLKSESNYTCVYLSNGKSILLSKTLKEIEQKLPSNIFARVHNSYIINCNFISSHHKGNRGFVVLKTGTQIPISRSRKDILTAIFNEMK